MRAEATVWAAGDVHARMSEVMQQESTECMSEFWLHTCCAGSLSSPVPCLAFSAYVRNLCFLLSQCRITLRDG